MVKKRPSLVGGLLGGSRRGLGARARSQAKLLLGDDGSDASETEPYDFGTSPTHKAVELISRGTYEAELEQKMSGVDITVPGEERKKALRRPSGGSNCGPEISSPTKTASSGSHRLSPMKSPSASSSCDFIQGKMAEAAAAMSSTQKKDHKRRMHRSKSNEGPSIMTMSPSSSSKHRASGDHSMDSSIRSSSSHKRRMHRSKSNEGPSIMTMPPSSSSKHRASGDHSMDSSIRSTSSRRRGVHRSKSTDMDASRTSRSSRSSKVRRHKSLDGDDSMLSLMRSSKTTSMESDTESVRRHRSGRLRRSRSSDLDRNSSHHSSRGGEETLRSSSHPSSCFSSDDESNATGTITSRSTYTRRSRRSATEKEKARRRERRSTRANEDGDNEDPSERSKDERRHRRHRSRDNDGKTRSRKSKGRSRSRSDDDIDGGLESDFSQSSRSTCIQLDVCDGSIRGLSLDTSIVLGCGASVLDDDGSLTSNSDLDQSMLHKQGSLTLYNTPWMTG